MVRCFGFAGTWRKRCASLFSGSSVGGQTYPHPPIGFQGALGRGPTEGLLPLRKSLFPPSQSGWAVTRLPTSASLRTVRPGASLWHGGGQERRGGAQTRRYRDQTKRRGAPALSNKMDPTGGSKAWGVLKMLEVETYCLAQAQKEILSDL